MSGPGEEYLHRIDGRIYCSGCANACSWMVEDEVGTGVCRLTNKFVLAWRFGPRLVELILLGVLCASAGGSLAVLMLRLAGALR